MKKARKTALSAILSAVAVVVMYVGSLFGKIDIATAVISSVCVMIILAETGFLRAVAAYAVISVLSFFIVPTKTAVMLFVALFGLYPVVKHFSEGWLGKGKSYIVKYIYLNLALALLFALTFLLFASVPTFVVIVIILAANIILPLYDFSLGGLLSFYHAKIRNKIL